MFQAALKFFPSSPSPSPKPGPTFHPHPTIPSLFTATQSQTVEYAVLPLENSTNGSVIFTLDLLADALKEFPDVRVVGEAYVKVEHCLLGFSNKRADASKDSSETQKENRLVGAENKDENNAVGISDEDRSSTLGLALKTGPPPDLAHIHSLYSHPQTWTQCSAFLSSYFPRGDPSTSAFTQKKGERKTVVYHDISSTSEAAKLVAMDKSGGSAALASRLAGEVYGLAVLRESVQDRGDNWTRFLVITHSENLAPSKNTETSASTPDHGFGHDNGKGKGQESGSCKAEQEKGTRYKGLVTLSFPLPPRTVGLGDALTVFKEFGLEVDKVECRPAGTVPWDHIFIVELGLRDGQAEHVSSVVEALERVCGKGRVREWGVWKGGWFV